LDQQEVGFNNSISLLSGERQWLLGLLDKYYNCEETAQVIEPNVFQNTSSKRRGDDGPFTPSSELASTWISLKIIHRNFSESITRHSNDYNENRPFHSACSIRTLSPVDSVAPLKI
jgi:hypothetical protein